MSSIGFILVEGFFSMVRSKNDAIAWLLIACIVGTTLLAIQHYYDKNRKQKKNTKIAIT